MVMHGFTFLAWDLIDCHGGPHVFWVSPWLLRSAPWLVSGLTGLAPSFSVECSGSCQVMEEKSDGGIIPMTEELSDLLVRLKFSEEELVQIMCNNDHGGRGFESWAIGKIMATETPNREAMYRVFKSLWYTKEEVEFVALKEGAVIVKFGCQEDRNSILNLTPWLFDRCLFSMLPFEKGKDIESYEFGWSPFWLRIYNIPLELMDRQ
ncbi:hypothetical protein Goklo_008198, partial [Gossypium klotzschianum]|nr:hypothetical protein [Gossypium klotzschianum]